MVTVNTSRETLVLALRSYGEDVVAESIGGISDEQLSAIGKLAGWYLSNAPSGNAGRSIFIDTALALAAVESIEGAPRALRLKRRRLKGLYVGY